MNGWSTVIIALICSAFFSGMEIAFVSANRLKIELDREKGKLGGRILSSFTKRPGRFIGALLLGNNVALVIYGIAMANLLEPVIKSVLPDVLMSELSVLLVQTVLSTALILITAEFLPKILFRLKPNAMINIFALPVYIFYQLFYPLVIIFIGSAEWLLKKLFRVRFSNKKYSFGMVDLDHYIREFSSDERSEEFNHQELQIIQNMIDFREVRVRECMVPRTEVVALDQGTDVSVFLETFHATGHSKLMIYDDNIDNIIGYAHAYDMFSKPKAIKEVMRSPIIVPETMPGKDVLQKFILQHKSLAVVVDEFGGTAGIVTMEDIMEEIFGEIHDEYDKEDQAEQIISDSEYIFSARLEIDYLNEKYRLDLPDSDDYETLAGLIIEHHHDIPNLHEVITIADGFEFTIVGVEENKISLVKLKVQS